MKIPCSTKLCGSAVLLALLLCIALGAPQQGSARENGFASWLESFGAWDVLEAELAGEHPTPETVLRRAELLMKQHKLQEALSLLDRFGRFSQAEAEGRRLWLKARAYRLREEHVQALLWYSQAGTQLEPEVRKEAFRKEPGFPFYLESIWKRWFWQRFTGKGLQANAGQQGVMRSAARLAETVWPEEPFWASAQGTLNRLEQGMETRHDDDPGMEVSREDRAQIAASLAALAVNHFPEAAERLEALESPELRDLWSRAVRSLFPEGFAQALQARALGLAEKHPKHKAFGGMVLPRLAQMRSLNWMVPQPQASNWSAFSERIRKLQAKKALQRIERELQSALLGQELQQALRQFRLAFAFLAQDDSRYESLWEESSVASLPLALRLCGVIHGLTDFGEAFASGVSSEDRRILFALLHTLQPKEDRRILAPFWISAETLQQQEDAGERPLDPLLAYYRLESAWSGAQSEALAKRIVLQFPKTELANKALLYLAKQAHEREHLRQASAYLKAVEPRGMPRDVSVRLLSARAGLAMERGQTQQSLSLYQELLEKAPQSLSAQKRLKIALLAQRQNEWGWGQRMLEDLWDKRQDLEPSLQAEVLFWLAEGDQKNGRAQRARKRYLQLAWEYPEETIWSVTALYRAALMYEQQGDLYTAGALLERVVERAGRKSQKEAAKDRLQGIEKRMQGEKPSAEPQFAF